MDKAPERIWVQNDTKDHRAELSEMAVEPVPEVTSCFQAYTCTDISNALIAAAYEAAAGIGDYFAEMDYGLMHYPESDALASGNTANEIRTSIRDLTPDDARAAYDAAIRAAKIEGMREAAVNLRTYAPHETDGPEHDVGYYAGYQTALNRITALIEETEKGGV